jgi:hypothetical protein
MPASSSRDTRQVKATGAGRAPRAASEHTKDKTTEPLRGDAAWRAQVKEIARRNEAACAAGARRRAAHDETLARESAEQVRREMQRLRDDDPAHH